LVKEACRLSSKQIDKMETSFGREKGGGYHRVAKKRDGEGECVADGEQKKKRQKWQGGANRRTKKKSSERLKAKGGRNINAAKQGAGRTAHTGYVLVSRRTGTS